MANAPPRTFIDWRAPAPRNSLNKNHPQNKPTRLLMFHNGKATESPTSRMAKTVSVFATAHRAPCKDRPNHQMSSCPEVKEDVTRAFQNGGKRPARNEHTRDHGERNHIG